MFLEFVDKLKGLNYVDYIFQSKFLQTV